MLISLNIITVKPDENGQPPSGLTLAELQQGNKYEAQGVWLNLRKQIIYTDEGLKQAIKNMIDEAFVDLQLKLDKLEGSNWHLYRINTLTCNVGKFKPLRG